MKTGSELKAEGQARAMANIHEEMKELFYALLKSFEPGGPFLIGDDFRPWAEERGVSLEEKQWGSMTSAASAKHIIRRTGKSRRSKRSLNHAGDYPLWEKVPENEKADRPVQKPFRFELVAKGFDGITSSSLERLKKRAPAYAKEKLVDLDEVTIAKVGDPEVVWRGKPI